MGQTYDCPAYLPFLAVILGVCAGVSLYWTTNWLRLCASQPLSVLGWASVVLFGVLTPVFFLAASQFGSGVMETSLACVAALIGSITGVACLHCKCIGVPFGVAFSHLMAEAFSVALLLSFASFSHNDLAGALCGSDHSWERFGQSLERVGILQDYFAIALCLALLVLELLRPLQAFMARHRAANR